MKQHKAKLAVLLALAMTFSLTTMAFAAPPYGPAKTSNGTIEFKAGEITVIDPTDPSATDDLPTSSTQPSTSSTDPEDTTDGGKFVFNSNSLSWGTRLVSSKTEEYMTNDPASKFDTVKGEIRPVHDLRKAGILVVDNSAQLLETWKVTVEATPFKQGSVRALQGCDFHLKPETAPWTDDGNTSTAPVFGAPVSVTLLDNTTVSMHDKFTWTTPDVLTSKSAPITLLTTKGLSASADGTGIANGAWYADWSGYLRVLPSSYSAGSEIKTELTWTVVKDV